MTTPNLVSCTHIVHLLLRDYTNPELKCLTNNNNNNNKIKKIYILLHSSIPNIKMEPLIWNVPFKALYGTIGKVKMALIQSKN